MDDTPKRKYLLTRSGSEADVVIEIPETWKITFASVNPAGNSQGMHGRDLHCVRVWEKKDVLRAVFCDCRGIRDLSIPVLRKITKETGSAQWTSDSLGNFEETSKRQLEEHYDAEDPDVIEFGVDS
jgi:hypothetical protein